VVDGTVVSGLLRSEILKLRTTRTTWTLLAFALAIVVGVLVLTLALLDHGETIDDDALGSLFSFTSIADLLVLCLAIVNAAGEFRHGTITAAFLLTPERWPVVVAKALAHLLMALLYGVVTLAVVAAIGLPWLAAKDATLDLSVSGWIPAAAGRLIYIVCFAVLGVGLGTLVRNQAAGLVAALVFLLAVEPALGAVSGAISKYGVSGASLALFGAGGSGDVVPFWAGALLLSGYALTLLATGTAITLRRDVS
jgi:ABC-2 type transport system permease protein